jgi:hypothetical protein
MVNPSDPLAAIPEVFVEMAIISSREYVQEMLMGRIILDRGNCSR